MMKTTEAINEVVIANHILANEGVLDAFGHVSVRNPQRPECFLMSVSKAPELVCTEDIIEYGPDSQPIESTSTSLYAERFIHGEIYKARPDVTAICHHHSPAVMPFCISGAPLVAVYQHGAMMGASVPLWDSRDDFGDTNLLITNAAQGASLAAKLAGASIVLMRHHGATVVGKSLQELVFRAVTSARNAQFLYQARLLGPVSGLSEGEIEKAGKIPDVAITRAWLLWKKRALLSDLGTTRSDSL